MNSYEQQRSRMLSAKPKPKATIAANAPDLRSYNYSRYHQIEKPLLPQQYSRIPATVAPSVSTIPLSSASEEEEEEPKVNEEEGNADAVWENLQEIFQDIDARSEGLEGRQQLKKPIMHLRRLLQMHSKIRAEEIQLEKMYLGVSYEREWYLRKLQAVEKPAFLGHHCQQLLLGVMIRLCNPWLRPLASFCMKTTKISALWDLSFHSLTTCKTMCIITSRSFSIYFSSEEEMLAILLFSHEKNAVPPYLLLDSERSIMILFLSRYLS